MRRTHEDDYRERPEEGRAGERSELMEAVDQLSRRVSGALMLAGGLIGLGLYASSGGVEVEAPRYQVFAADGEVFRVNTDSGTVIACNATRCMRVLERGQDLAEGQGATLFKTPPGAQLPAPQSAAPPATTQPVAPQAPGPEGQPAAPALPPPR